MERCKLYFYLSAFKIAKNGMGSHFREVLELLNRSLSTTPTQKHRSLKQGNKKHEQKSGNDNSNESWNNLEEKAIPKNIYIKNSKDVAQIMFVRCQKIFLSPLQRQLRFMNTLAQIKQPRITFDQEKTKYVLNQVLENQLSNKKAIKAGDTSFKHTKKISNGCREHYDSCYISTAYPHHKKLLLFYRTAPVKIIKRYKCRRSVNPKIEEYRKKKSMGNAKPLVKLCLRRKKQPDKPGFIKRFFRKLFGHDEVPKCRMCPKPPSVDSTECEFIRYPLCSLKPDRSGIDCEEKDKDDMDEREEHKRAPCSKKKAGMEHEDEICIDKVRRREASSRACNIPCIKKKKSKSKKCKGKRKLKKKLCKAVKHKKGSSIYGSSVKCSDKKKRSRKNKSKCKKGLGLCAFLNYGKNKNDHSQDSFGYSDKDKTNYDDRGRNSAISPPSDINAQVNSPLGAEASVIATERNDKNCRAIWSKQLEVKKERALRDLDKKQWLSKSKIKSWQTFITEPKIINRMIKDTATKLLNSVEPKQSDVNKTQVNKGYLGITKVLTEKTINDLDISKTFKPHEKQNNQTVDENNTYRKYEHPNIPSVERMFTDSSSAISNVNKAVLTNKVVMKEDVADSIPTKLCNDKDIFSTKIDIQPETITVRKFEEERETKTSLIPNIECDEKNQHDIDHITKMVKSNYNDLIPKVDTAEVLYPEKIIESIEGEQMSEKNSSTICSSDNLVAESVQLKDEKSSVEHKLSTTETSDDLYSELVLNRGEKLKSKESLAKPKTTNTIVCYDRSEPSLKYKNAKTEKVKALSTEGSIYEIMGRNKMNESSTNIKKPIIDANSRANCIMQSLFRNEKLQTDLMMKKSQGKKVQNQTWKTVENFELSKKSERGEHNFPLEDSRVLSNVCQDYISRAKKDLKKINADKKEFISKASNLEDLVTNGKGVGNGVDIKTDYSKRKSGTQKHSCELLSTETGGSDESGARNKIRQEGFADKLELHKELSGPMERNNTLIVNEGNKENEWKGGVDLSQIATSKKIPMERKGFKTTPPLHQNDISNETGNYNATLSHESNLGSNHSKTVLSKILKTDSLEYSEFLKRKKLSNRNKWFKELNSYSPITETNVPKLSMEYGSGKEKYDAEANESEDVLKTSDIIKTKQASKELTGSYKKPEQKSETDNVEGSLDTESISETIPLKLKDELLAQDENKSTEKRTSTVDIEKSDFDMYKPYKKSEKKYEIKKADIGKEKEDLVHSRTKSIHNNKFEVTNSTNIPLISKKHDLANQSEKNVKETKIPPGCMKGSGSTCSVIFSKEGEDYEPFSNVNEMNPPFKTFSNIIPNDITDSTLSTDHTEKHTHPTAVIKGHTPESLLTSVKELDEQKPKCFLNSENIYGENTTGNTKDNVSSTNVANKVFNNVDKDLVTEKTNTHQKKPSRGYKPSDTCTKKLISERISKSTQILSDYKEGKGFYADSTKLLDPMKVTTGELGISPNLFKTELNHRHKTKLETTSKPQIDGSVEKNEDQISTTSSSSSSFILPKKDRPSALHSMILKKITSQTVMETKDVQKQVHKSKNAIDLLAHFQEKRVSDANLMAFYLKDKYNNIKEHNNNALLGIDIIQDCSLAHPLSNCFTTRSQKPEKVSQTMESDEWNHFKDELQRNSQNDVAKREQ